MAASKNRCIKLAASSADHCVVELERGKLRACHANPPLASPAILDVLYHIRSTIARAVSRTAPQRQPFATPERPAADG